MDNRPEKDEYIRKEQRVPEHRVYVAPYRANLLKPVEPEFAKFWGELIWRVFSSKDA